MFFNFKQYVSFFAALFIIQTFYGLIAVSNANNNVIEYQHVQDEYDYHMVLRDLNEDQYLYLENNSAAVFKNDTIFKILRYEQNRNYMTGQNRYDMYLYFVRDKDISCERFYNKYLEPLKSLGREGESFVITETPLLRFEHNEQSNLSSFIFTTLLLLAVSIFLLTALYNIRVNQVVPGAIRTDRWDEISEEEEKKRRSNWPLGIESTGEDIANAAAFLASEEASYITAQTLCVDGALSL